MKSINSQSGIVILIALLIIAGVLASATILGGLIIQDIQQARLLDDSIQAYYYAESGAERALHQTRKRDALQPQDCELVDPSSTCHETLGVCTDSDVACITMTPNTFPQVGPNNSDWVVDIANESLTTFSLGAGESFQIDLFSPYDIAAQETSGIESIVLQSLNNSAFSIYGQLTNLTVLVDPTTLCMGTPTSTVSQGYISGANYSATITGLPSMNISSDCAYVVRFSKSLGATEDIYTLSLYNEEDPNIGEQVAIPSRLLVESEGTYRNATQRVKVRTPIRPPLSGLYDFVLFSEEEIVK